ncbi:MAG: hypothetical protein NVSMB66_0190 [Candidatus Doudnabacteria bacterium]
MDLVDMLLAILLILIVASAFFTFKAVRTIKKSGHQPTAQDYFLLGNSIRGIVTCITLLLILYGLLAATAHYE